jgi:hypothetical protein
MHLPANKRKDMPKPALPAQGPAEYARLASLPPIQQAQDKTPKSS